MVRSTDGKFVLALLACCVLPLQTQASGRPPRSPLPDTLAVNAAVMALADSLDYGRLEWFWAAPDGACWLGFNAGVWYSAMRRIEPDGRVGTADVVLPGHATYAAPLAMLRDGDILICHTDRMYGGRLELARVGVEYKRILEPRARSSFDIGRTTLVDKRDVVHAFVRGRHSDQAYLRYSVTQDSVLELSRRPFQDSVVWTQNRGYRHVRLPGEAPWGLGNHTAVQWDGDGIIVGATTTGWSSETPEVFRFRVPDCRLLARTDFEVASTAHFKTVGIGFEGFRMVKSGKGYWLFVPSVDSVTVERQKVQCIYSCRLDANLNPVRPAAISGLTAHPFAEAPPDSKVEVSLLDEYVDIPSYGPDKRAFTLRFIAFGPDGHIYCTEMHDTIMTHRDNLTDAGELQVVGGGDSVGPVSVVVPLYPGMALQASIEGSVGVTVFAGSNGEVDSATVSKSGGNRQLDDAALRAARKARFAGSAFRGGTHPVACDLTYRFTLLKSGVDVRVVEARLRQK